MKTPRENTRNLAKGRLARRIAIMAAACVLVGAFIVPLWLSASSPATSSLASAEYSASSSSAANDGSLEPSASEAAETNQVDAGGTVGEIGPSWEAGAVISNGEDGIAAEHEAGVVLVRVAEDASASSVNEALSKVDCVQPIEISDADINLGYVAVPLSDGVSVPDAMQQLQQLPVVKGSQPNFLYHIADDASGSGDLTAGAIADAVDVIGSLAVTLNDKDSSKQWALTSIHAYEAWEISKAENKDVTVAVVDTGCYSSHDDLYDNIANLYDATGVSGVGDLSGHGTHVCGIVSAVANNNLGVAGVSYNAKVLPIQVFKSYGSKKLASTEALVAAYQFIDDYPQYNVRVVNMSLGVDAANEEELVGFDTEDQALYNAVLNARENGILTVCSSGNDGNNGPYLNYPSDYLADCALTVIALQQTADKTSVERAPYSNYNMTSQMTKEISAPGSQIYSLDASGKRSFKYLSGTSMASPCVAGVAALLFAAKSDLTPDQVERILCDTATDLGDELWDPVYGAGEVDAENALAHLGSFLDGASSILVGGSCTLEPHDLLETGAWTWSVEGETADGQPVASVDDNGTVTGLRGGAAVVTASRGQVSISRTITVYDVSFSEGDTIWAGDTLALVFNEDPDTGMWIVESQNEGVATVNVTSEYILVTGVSPGRATITATLASNSDLVVSREIEVTAARTDISRAQVEAEGWTYDGKKHVPTVKSVRLGNTTLGPDDVTVKSYTGGKDAGTYKVVVEPVDRQTYKGEATGTYTISQRQVTLTSKSASKVYDGVALVSTAVTVGGSGFVPGEVSNLRATGSITNAGSTVNTIAYTKNTGYKDANYSVKKTQGRLTVTARSLSGANLSSISSQTYTGSAIKPVPTVTVNGKVLKNGTDYTLSYSNNLNAGTATVIATGKGNYTGTVSRTFTINRAPLHSAALSQASYTYDGTAKSPTLIVKNAAGKTLRSGVDYTATTPSGRTSQGSYTYTATGIGNYQGSVRTTLTVSRASVSAATLSQDAFPFDGQQKNPSLTVRGSDGRTLVRGVDYTVSEPDGRVWLGTYTYTVTGMGNYAGTASASFTISATPHPLYRLYQSKTGEHHYTLSLDEVGICTDKWGWTYEGVAWDCPSESGTPVYRLFNSETGLHHYTTSAKERDICVDRWGWTYENVAWYSYGESGAPVYRLFHPKTGHHHYTLSLDEVGICTDKWGWVYEGVSWYGLG